MTNDDGVTAQYENGRRRFEGQKRLESSSSFVLVLGSRSRGRFPFWEVCLERLEFEDEHEGTRSLDA
jgi:hypothetical protein